MNRRGFLRFLALAPVVGPMAIKALATIAPAAAAPAALATPVSSEAVKAWASRVWIDMPRTIYWGGFMKAGSLVEPSLEEPDA